MDLAVLNAAVEGAAQRTLGDAWAWSRRSSRSNVTPLVAASAGPLGGAGGNMAQPVELRAWILSRYYGGRHQRIRAALLSAAYGEICHLCGRPMLPGQALELDRTADRAGYRGMAHAHRNRSEGARRGNAARRRRPGGVFWAA
jgi:hypothetical protein